MEIPQRILQIISEVLKNNNLYSIVIHVKLKETTSIIL
jgi:hypothetical protein